MYISIRYLDVPNLVLCPERVLHLVQVSVNRRIRLSLVSIAFGVVFGVSGRQWHFRTHCTRTDIMLLSSEIFAASMESSAQRSAFGSRYSGRSRAMFSVGSETEEIIIKAIFCARSIISIFKNYNGGACILNSSLVCVMRSILNSKKLSFDFVS